MFLGMGSTELLFILVIVLIIFGPKQLPKLGQTLGKTVKNVREGMNEAEAEMNSSTTNKQIENSEDVEDVEPEEVATASEKSADNDDSTSTDTGAAAKDKFCPECGTKNPHENKFCVECGNKLQ